MRGVTEGKMMPFILEINMNLAKVKEEIQQEPQQLLPRANKVDQQIS